MNIRDSLYFTLRKMVDQDDNRLNDCVIHSPFEREFGREDIAYFISFFSGYLLGRWETLPRERLKPFVQRIPASFLIIGYCKGETYEMQFESTEEYEDAWEQFQGRIERELKSNKADSPLVLDEHSQDDLN